MCSMAGAVGLEPTWLLSVGFGDRCNRRYTTPLYLSFISYIYIISYFFIKINKEKLRECNVNENYIPSI